MKKLLIIIFIFSLLLCGCTQQEVNTKSEITVIETDNTLNGYLPAGVTLSETEATAMPETIKDEDVTVIDNDPTEALAQYLGNKNSKVFHFTTCTYGKKSNEENRIYFSSREEFVNNGYTPCKVCNP